MSWLKKIEPPTDPTPTIVRWKIEGDFLIGVEWPESIDHYDRLAGKMILDGGEWRSLVYIGIELPRSVEKALTLRFDP